MLYNSYLSHFYTLFTKIRLCNTAVYRIIAVICIMYRLDNNILFLIHTIIICRDFFRILFVSFLTSSICSGNIVCASSKYNFNVLCSFVTALYSSIAFSLLSRVLVSMSIPFTESNIPSTSAAAITALLIVYTYWNFLFKDIVTPDFFNFFNYINIV